MGQARACSRCSLPEWRCRCAPRRRPPAPAPPGGGGTVLVAGPALPVKGLSKDKEKEKEKGASSDHSTARRRVEAVRAAADARQAAAEAQKACAAGVGVAAVVSACVAHAASFGPAPIDAVKAVGALCARHAKAFSAQAAARALPPLAALAARVAPAPAEVTAATRALVEAIHGREDELTPAELGEAGRALGALRVPLARDALVGLASAAGDVAPTMSARDVAGVLIGLSRCWKPDSLPPSLPALVDAAAAAADQLQPADIAEVVYAVGALALDPNTGAHAELAHALARHAKSLSGDHVTRAWEGYALLGLVPGEDVLCALRSATLRCSDSVPVLAASVWALSVLGQPVPTSLISAIHKSVERQRWAPREMCRVFYAAMLAEVAGTSFPLSQRVLDQAERCWRATLIDEPAEEEEEEAIVRTLRSLGVEGVERGARSDDGLFRVGVAIRPPGAKPIALLVEPEQNFTANSNEPLGPIRSLHRLLSHRGWDVRVTRTPVWRALGGCADDEAAMLRGLLGLHQNGCVPSGPAPLKRTQSTPPGFSASSSPYAHPPARRLSLDGQ